MDTAAGSYRFGRFQLDASGRRLLVDGVAAKLGSRAIDVLLVLVRERGRIVSKDELLDRVWPGLVVEENNLQVQISALRKLLGASAIATIPGRGYQFVAELQTAQATGEQARPPAVDPGADATPAVSQSLPLRLPPLIGRDADLAEARALLAEHALLTLTGPGGIGKTSLAHALAAAVGADFPDGVHVLALAAVTDPARLPAVVAGVLGVQLLRGHAPEAVIAAALRDQRTLIVLDNCEHLLEATAALVHSILRGARLARVLATSQAPLRVSGEQVLRLAPLSLPPTPTFDPAAVERYGALQLFVARARAVQRGFALSPETAALAAEICRRLDGLPLAIELAAAGLPLLGLTGLHQKLDACLRVLTTGMREAPARQQTLRATLVWSHALLSPQMQTAFRRLGVFTGGFSLDLAQRVAARAGEEPSAALDCLSVLVEKSLLVAEGDPLPRYRLLETARAFALEQLHAAGELDATERHRADAMRELVSEFDDAIAWAPRFDVLVRDITPEMDNLRAALRWAMNAPDARTLALSILAASNALWIEVDPFGDAIDHYLRARSWLDDDSVSPALAARFRMAFQALARTRLVQPAIWGPEAWKALAAYRELGDRVGLYKALCALGGAPREVIDDAQAGALLAEAEKIEDPAWSPRQRSRRQLALEWYHDLGGRFDACREAGVRHVALAKQAGALGYIPALSNLADTEFVLGNHDVAIALCRQAIEVAATIGRPAAAIHAYGNMVPALLELGRVDEAAAAIRGGRSLMLRGIGSAFTLLMSLAPLAQQRSDLLLATRLVGCADRHYAQGGHHMHPPEKRLRQRVLTAVLAAHAAASVDAWLREGASWNEDEAFAAVGIT